MKYIFEEDDIRVGLTITIKHGGKPSHLVLIKLYNPVRYYLINIFSGRIYKSFEDSKNNIDDLLDTINSYNAVPVRVEHTITEIKIL